MTSIGKILKDENKSNHGRNFQYSQTFNIEKVYIKLNDEINKKEQYRIALQKEQDKLWSIIKQNCSNHSLEMKRISNKIGTCTHEINILIKQLLRYKHVHKSMNIAYHYLNNEIDRCSKICLHNHKIIQNVENGRCILINSNGVHHADASGLRNYVKNKETQLNSLIKWRNSIKNYVA